MSKHRAFAVPTSVSGSVLGPILAPVSGPVSAFVGLSLMLAAFTPGQAAAANVCATQAERVGLEMRVLQSDLMVAALTCGQRGDYNAFVTAFKPYLKKHSASLQSFFRKAYGERAVYQLNRMVTRLANQASSRTLTGADGTYCAQAQARFDTILSAEPAMLPRIARTNPAANAHGYTSCTVMAEKVKAVGEVEVAGNVPSDAN